SLVLYDDQEGRARYRLLESVRQYGREKLAAEPDGSMFRRQHRDYFLSLAEEAREQLLGAEQGEWLERFEAEHENLRTAHDFCAADPESGEAGLRLAGCLWRFWETRGYYGEGRERCRAALSHA